MIRAVLDTNVVVSAFIGMAQGFAEANPRRIFQAIEDEIVLPLTSAEAIQELEEVLNRPRIAKRHRLSGEEVSKAVDRFAQSCEFVIIEDAIHVITTDPDDNVFLAIAISGRADVVVSGDPHLLALKGFQGISILTPAKFVETFLSK